MDNSKDKVLGLAKGGVIQYIIWEFRHINRVNLLVVTCGEIKFMGIDGDNLVDLVLIRWSFYIMIASIFLSEIRGYAISWGMGLQSLTIYLL